MNCVAHSPYSVVNRDSDGSIRFAYALSGRHLGVTGVAYRTDALIAGIREQSKPVMATRLSSKHNLTGVDVSFSDHR